MQRDGWNAVGVAGHLPVQVLAVADVQHALVMRLDVWEERHGEELGMPSPDSTRASRDRGLSGDLLR